MGATRNGARSFLEALRTACRMSHMNGFLAGMNEIMGPGPASDLLSLWTPLCSLVDVMIGLDNFFNQRDTSDDDGAGEDEEPGI